MLPGVDRGLLCRIPYSNQVLVWTTGTPSARRSHGVPPSRQSRLFHPGASCQRKLRGGVAVASAITGACGEARPEAARRTLKSSYPKALGVAEDRNWGYTARSQAGTSCRSVGKGRNPLPRSRIGFLKDLHFRQSLRT